MEDCISEHSIEEGKRDNLLKRLNKRPTIAVHFSSSDEDQISDFMRSKNKFLILKK